MENRRPQSYIDSVAFDAAGLSRESASNLRKRVDEAARMAARRRSCLSLGKHVASAMKSVWIASTILFGALTHQNCNSC
ncbi:hypothetical protein PMI06_006589 [Burkholderia sp. BT03]|nr:hypothetical protein PMI06_006589 [Burkholderia sp. BT03]SKC93963.1 hypothetical protein SAMN06266956_5838 [Paraburkholderia hospita]